jgi:hypothetical protein
MKDGTYCHHVCGLFEQRHAAESASLGSPTSLAMVQRSSQVLTQVLSDGVVGAELPQCTLRVRGALEQRRKPDGPRR